MASARNKLPIPPVTSRDRLQRRGRDVITGHQTFTHLRTLQRVYWYWGRYQEHHHLDSTDSSVRRSASHHLYTSFAEFMTGPGTSSHSAGAMSPAISFSKDPSSPSPGNISHKPDVAVTLRDLHNGGNDIPLRFVMYSQSRPFQIATNCCALSARVKPCHY
jgi:hypothetical protein